MKFIARISALLTIILFSNSLCASEKTIIYIDIIGNPKFEVIYHRAKTNAIGAVAAGLIGAGIQAGVESSKDEKKTKAIQPMIEGDYWKSHFLDTINNSLESKNYKAEWVDGSKKISKGLVLKIYAGYYGIKIADTATMLMSSYVDFNATLTNLDKKEKEGKKKNFYITSKTQKTYENFSSDKVLLNTDLQDALTMAAKRIANKIIYSKGV